MKNILLFIKRNLLEMVRDPLVYIFCAGFPVAMFLLFQLIVHNTGDTLPTFNIKSLVPGITIFAYSLLMLIGGLLISKDKTSAFLRRLFTSPLKSYQFIIGYFVPFFFMLIFKWVLIIYWYCGSGCEDGGQGFLRASAGGRYAHISRWWRCFRGRAVAE